MSADLNNDDFGKCTRYNSYSVNNKTFVLVNGFEGIPQNIIINILISFTILLLFLFLRKKCWEYGKVRLVTHKDKINSFALGDYLHPTHDESTRLKLSEESLAADWRKVCKLPGFLRISDAKLEELCGTDALLYISFMRHLIVFMLPVMFVAIIIILPINLHGNMRTVKDNEFALQTISNVPGKSNVLWTHVVMSTLTLVWSLIVMTRFLRIVAKKKNHNMSRTVLLKNVDTHQFSASDLERLIKHQLNFKNVSEVTIAFDVKKMMEFYRLRRKYEQALYQCFLRFDEEKHRPVIQPRCHCCCCCLIGQYKSCQTVDAIEFYTDRVKTYSSKYLEEKQNVLDHKQLDIAFITFSSNKDFIEFLMRFSRFTQTYLWCRNQVCRSTSTSCCDCVARCLMPADLSYTTRLIPDNEHDGKYAAEEQPGSQHDVTHKKEREEDEARILVSSFGSNQIKKRDLNANNSSSSTSSSSASQSAHPHQREHQLQEESEVRADHFEFDDWIAIPSPTASDILWQNLSSPAWRWYLATVLWSIVILFCVVFFSTPSMILNMLTRIKLAQKLTDMNFSPLVVQFLPTLIMLATTALLRYLIYASDQWIPHKTRTQLNKSLLTKTFAYIILCVLVLPSLGLTSGNAFLFWLFPRDNSTLNNPFDGKSRQLDSQFQCIFLPDGGALFVNYVITSTFIGCALQILRVDDLIQYLVRMLCCRRSSAETDAVRQSLLWEWEFGPNYAWHLGIFSLIISYAFLCPIITVFGMLYLCVQYIVDRHNLVNVFSRSSVQRSVHYTAAAMMLVACLFLHLNITIFLMLRRSDYIRDPLALFSIVVMFVALLAFVARLLGSWVLSLLPYNHPIPKFVRLMFPYSEQFVLNWKNDDPHDLVVLESSPQNENKIVGMETGGHTGVAAAGDKAKMVGDEGDLLDSSNSTAALSAAGIAAPPIRVDVQPQEEPPMGRESLIHLGSAMTGENANSRRESSSALTDPGESGERAKRLSRGISKTHHLQFIPFELRDENDVEMMQQRSPRSSETAVLGGGAGESSGTAENLHSMKSLNPEEFSPLRQHDYAHK